MMSLEARESPWRDSTNANQKFIKRLVEAAKTCTGGGGQSYELPKFTMTEFVKHYDTSTALHLRAFIRGASPDQPDSPPLWQAFLAPKGLFETVVKYTGRMIAKILLEHPESPEPYEQIQCVLAKYHYGKPKQPSIHRTYTQGSVFLPVWSIAAMSVVIFASAIVENAFS